MSKFSFDSSDADSDADADPITFGIVFVDCAGLLVLFVFLEVGNAVLAEPRKRPRRR